MKKFLIAIGVLAVGYGAYDRYYLPKLEKQAAAQAEASADGPTYYVTERGKPVLRVTADTRARVDRFSSETVVMFGASWCGYCAENRKVFAERGIQYVEIDIDQNAGALPFMQKVLGAKGVPTTILGTRLIPGYNAQELDDALKRL